MLGALFHLSPNIGEDDLSRDGKEAPSIDRCDRAMAAGVLAATGGFCVSHDPRIFAIVAPLQAGIAFKWRQLPAIRDEKWCALQPGSAIRGTCGDTRNR